MCTAVSLSLPYCGSRSENVSGHRTLRVALSYRLTSYKRILAFSALSSFTCCMVMCFAAQMSVLSSGVFAAHCQAADRAPPPNSGGSRPSQ